MTEDRLTKKNEAAPAIDMGVLPQVLGYMLRQSQLLVYHAFQDAVNDDSIRPPQFSILELVARNPGIRPSDVAAGIGVTRANLVPLLAELEKSGFLLRKGDRNDGRAQALYLTEAGKAQRQRLHEVIIPLEDRLAESLGPGGREALLHFLTLLNAAAAKR